jgi:hypothetical protein
MTRCCSGAQAQRTLVGQTDREPQLQPGQPRGFGQPKGDRGDGALRRALGAARFSGEVVTIRISERRRSQVGSGSLTRRVVSGERH